MLREIQSQNTWTLWKTLQVALYPARTASVILGGAPQQYVYIHVTKPSSIMTGAKEEVIEWRIFKEWYKHKEC